jgi:hypothetical protein
MRAARVMFPHDTLPDEAYAKVVDQLELGAGNDAAVATTIEEGIARLDDPRPFAELDPHAQLAVLERSEGSGFFDLMKATAVVELYDNPLVWKALGYEGPSVHLGGYLERGFDDLDWLPEPPIALDPTAAYQR